jgi:hypothetical protein
MKQDHLRSTELNCILWILVDVEGGEFSVAVIKPAHAEYPSIVLEVRMLQ